METLENSGQQSSGGDGTARSTVIARPDGALGKPLRPKVEHFAQAFASHGNATRAYREAFDVSPATRIGTVRQRAYELVHEPAVAARVRALLAVAAEGTTISARTRMVRLQDIIEADPSELFRIVTEPCAGCWNTDALVAALDRGEVPESSAPQDSCPQCRGHGVQRVLITPTDQLSPAARKLLKGVRQKASGEIEVRLQDQLAASDQLNRMQGVYVDRSVTVTATVDATKSFEKMTEAEMLAFLATLEPPAVAQGAAPIERTVIDVTPEPQP